LRKARRETLSAYQALIDNIVNLINRKGANQIRRANIFTTNYDLFFENASDKLLRNSTNFIFNDGARGLKTRYLQISNFHTSTWHQGTNDLYKFEIPTINLIKCMVLFLGKVNEEKIEVTYPSSYPKDLEIDLDIPDIQTAIELIEDFTLYHTAKESLALTNDDELALKNSEKNMINSLS
jgi:hypothetical protein